MFCSDLILHVHYRDKAAMVIFPLHYYSSLYSTGYVTWVRMQFKDSKRYIYMACCKYIYRYFYVYYQPPRWKSNVTSLYEVTIAQTWYCTLSNLNNNFPIHCFTDICSYVKILVAQAKSNITKSAYIEQVANKQQQSACSYTPTVIITANLWCSIPISVSIMWCGWLTQLTSMIRTIKSNNCIIWIHLEMLHRLHMLEKVAKKPYNQMLWSRE